jgi:hypothetical protein
MSGEDYPDWDDNGSWMEDETPFCIPQGKKLVCYLVDDATAAKLTGSLVLSAASLLAACEAFMKSVAQITKECPELRTEDSVSVDISVWFAVKEAVAGAKGKE